MVIVMDMDGVLCDFMAGFYAIHNKNWDIHTHTHYDVMEGLSKQEVKSAWNHVRKSRDFWYNLIPLCTEDELDDVAEMNHMNDVYFVTSREGKNVKNQTRAWLEKFNIRNPSVIITPWKGEVAKAVGANFSLEDKAGNAVAIAYLAPECRSYIIDRQYNQFGDSIGTKVRRIKTVSEFYNEVYKAS